MTGAHIGFGKEDGYVFYPVDEDNVNLGYFKMHPEPWGYFPNVTHKLSKRALIEDMQSVGANPKHLALVGLLPDEIDIWGLMHLKEALPSYSNGRIALMGEAAHACSPFLSSGAGQGYEDAVVCAELLLAIFHRKQKGRMLYAELETALKIYSDQRMHRSQDVVRNSHEAGKLCMGALPFDEAAREYARLNHDIWDGNIDDMVRTALAQLSNAFAERKDYHGSDG